LTGAVARSPGATLAAPRERPLPGQRGGEAVRTGLIHAVLWLNTALMLYPILLVALSAFKSTGKIYSTPFALPQSFNLADIETIWRKTNFPCYLANSLLVTAASIALIVVFATTAAYALARYTFRGNELLYLFFLSGLMLPLKLAVIPLFIQLTAFGLVDTLAGLVVVYTAMGLPSAVFILTGFLRTLPKEFEESARIDGASEARIMWSVMLPLARPAMVIAAINNAVPIWNDFFFPCVHPVRSLENPAAGIDRVHGRVPHGLGRAFRRAHSRGAADHASLRRALPAVHCRPDVGRGEIRQCSRFPAGRWWCPARRGPTIPCTGPST
jgi:raffinose/stachyose/melibiose transport system permease protein